MNNPIVSIREAFDPGSAWIFGFGAGSGYQETVDKHYYQFYAWAVRDGDVAPVPIPATIYLFGTGLLGLLRFKRHKCNRQIKHTYLSD